MSTPAMWPHQLKALDLVKIHDGCMLAMDMGSGKSRVIIEWINEQEETDEPD